MVGRPDKERAVMPIERRVNDLIAAGRRQFSYSESPRPRKTVKAKGFFIEEVTPYGLRPHHGCDGALAGGLWFRSPGAVTVKGH